MLKTLAAAATIALSALLPLTAAAQEATADAAAPVEITDFSIGSPDAKVQVTEYASFTTPPSGRSSRPITSTPARSASPTARSISTATASGPP